MSLIKEFNLQLYSLRELTKHDFPEVLKKVAKAGYTGVEFAGYENLSSDYMGELLDMYGLKSVSSHVSMERLLSALDDELDYNQKIGTQTIIVPYTPIATAQDVEILAKQLTHIAKTVKSAGFSFGYHNHAHEFAELEGGKNLLDFLMELTDPDEVTLELDVYWTAYAGVDVLTYMEKQRNRIRLLHLKQMSDLKSKECVDLDKGVLDFDMILRKGLEVGVKHFILEQEEFALSPYSSIEKGYKYIMNL